MRIEIKDTVIGSKPSDSVAAIIFRLDATDSDDSFLRELDLIKIEEEDDDLDLSHWVRSLDRFDRILSTYITFIPMCGGGAHIDDDHSCKDAVCSILRFLKVLLKRGKKKKYFQLFDHVGQLLKAFDIEVLELAVSVIFYACLPSTSLTSSPLEADWKEGVEVSREIADDALIILEGLGLLSTEYGLMDYLHGHFPDSANHKEQTFVIKFPAVEKKEAAINLDAENNGESKAMVDDVVSEYVVTVPTGGCSAQLLVKCDEISNTPDERVAAALTALNADCARSHELLLLSVLRAVDGLRGSQTERLRIVCLRVQCLLIISHSRLTHDLLHPYIKAGSTVLRDLISLSDISSEAFSALQLESSSLSTVSLILNCILGILEFNLRRRGPLLSGILIELGLTRTGGVMNADDPLENTYDSPWGSIVMSASTVATSVLESLTNLRDVEVGDRNGDSSKQREIVEVGRVGGGGGVMSVSSEVSADALTNFYSEYVCLSLNLFATCMTSRDSHHIPNDTPIIGAIVGVIVSTITPLRTAQTTLDSNKSAKRLRCENDWLIRPLVTALNCLEICISKIGYLVAFRECEGLGPVTDVIEIFGNNAQLLPNQVRNSMKSVLDSAFALLCNIASNTRRTATGPAESGVQILYQQYFSKLCCHVFRCPYQSLKATWAHLLVLIRLAIDAEPAFLAQFLRSTYAIVLTEVLRKCNRSCLLQSNCEGLVMPLARLAGSMCITPEGQAYVISNGLLPCVVEILVDPSLVHPQGDGLSADAVARCGRIIVQTARDHEHTRPHIRSAFSEQIEILCAEAKRIHKNLPIHEEPSLESPRIQILQRLMNLCVVLENMSSEGRRQTNELMKEILNEGAIESLVSAFSCTLPASRQLLAQLSMRHSGIPFFGYYPGAKAITSLLRVAAILAPQSILPVLFRAVDETLCLLSASKVALRALQNAKSPTQTSQKSTPVKGGFDFESGGSNTPGSGPNSWPRRRARSRGGSFGQQGADVLILGVLDCIPHRCIFDADFLTAEFNRSLDLETQTYRFLCATLQLEWLSSMISNGLLPMQRAQGQSLITAGRDLFRRLFAFQRSYVLEVCRFSASKWTPKPMNDCRSKRGLNDSFAEFDSTEDENKILRVPREYVLRVLNSTGALIREQCEIECSRGIFTASPGSVCVAYERSQTSSGVVRFRTAHGWLSEYRRDQQRDPIMELLSLTPCRASDDDEALQAELKNDPVKRKLMEAMTMRESASYAMTRVHNALKKVAVYLVSLCHVDPAAQRISAPRATSALSGSASLLSGSLSKILRSFLTHPDSCLLEDQKPKSMKKFKGEENNSEKSGEDKKKMKSSGSSSSFEKDRNNKMKKIRSSGGSDSAKSPMSGNSVSSKSEEDEEEIPPKECVTIDSATTCLYFGAVSKNILDPVLHDRNGQFNTYLLRALSAHGAIDAFLEALVFVLASLSDAITESQVQSQLVGTMSVCPEGEVSVLSRSGRCALHAIPYMLLLLRKLVQRDSYLKSRITASMVDLSDDIGPFQMHALLYKTFSSAAKALLPAFKYKLLKYLPSELQQEWIGIMGDLVCSLQTPLPPAVLSITTPQAPVSAAQTQSRSTGAIPSSSGNFSANLSPAPPLRVTSQTARDRELEENVQTYLQGMGFVRADIELALQATQSNETDVVMDYLLNNPRGDNTLTSPPEGEGVARLDVTFSGGSTGVLEGQPPIPDTLSALMGDISIVGTSDSLASTGTGVGEALQAPTQGGGGVISSGPPVVSGEVAADGSVPRVDLGQLINALSRLCVDESTPENQSPRPLPPGESAPTVPDPFLAQRGHVTDARLLLQALGRRGLHDEGTPTPPAPNSDNAAVFQAAGLWEQYRQEALAGKESDVMPDDARDEPLPEDEVAKQTLELQHLASLFREHSVANVLEISNLGDEISKWGAIPDRSQTLIPQMCRFLSNINEDPNASEAPLQDTYFQLIKTLLDRMDLAVLAFASHTGLDPPSDPSPLNNKSSSQLYGTLHLLLCLLRNKKIKAEIDPYLSRTFAESLVGTLLKLIKSYEESSSKKIPSESDKTEFWPLWISPLCVLLFELATATVSVTEAVMSSVTDLNTPARIDDSEEKAETFVAEEKESEELCGVSVKDVEKGDTEGEVDEGELSLELGALLRFEVENASLLPEHSWDLIFDSISSILQASSTRLTHSENTLKTVPVPASKEGGKEVGKDTPIGILGPKTRYLDPSSSQGVLLLLHTLISKQNLACKFVQLSGVETLLSLPACSVCADSASMLSLILQRCMESPAELNQQMIFAIRALLKPVRDARIALPMFLNFSTPHLLRAPEEYIAAVMTAVRFVRKPDEDSQTVCVELYKKEILEKRIIKAEAESAFKNPEVDAVALKVLNTLVLYLTEDSADGGEVSDGVEVAMADAKSKGTIDSKKSEKSKKDREKSGKGVSSREKGCMYFRGDVLEALSDCAVGLRRLPVLLAQYKLFLPTAHTDRDSDSVEAVSIPDFLIRHYFPLEGAEGSPRGLAIGVSEIRSACRLLVALSTQRGTPRRAVLTALVQAIRDCATVTLTVPSVEGADQGTDLGSAPGTQSLCAGQEAPETCSRRLRTLTRLASMVTLVVKASGTTGVQDPSSATHTPQQVSVDVVNHFISTDLPGLFSTALSSVPLGHALAGEAINAILDPLEMMTRPKLLANLDKLNAVTQAGESKSTPSQTAGADPAEVEETGFPPDWEVSAEIYQRLAEEWEGMGEGALDSVRPAVGAANSPLAQGGTIQGGEAGTADGRVIDPTDRSGEGLGESSLEGDIPEAWSPVPLPSEDGLFRSSEGEGEGGAEGGESEDNDYANHGYDNDDEDDDDDDQEDGAEGGELYGCIDEDFEDNEDEDDDEEEDDDEFESHDDDGNDEDEDDDDSEEEDGGEEGLVPEGDRELRRARRHFNSPAVPDARAERARRYFRDHPVVFELPLGASVADMMLSANAMIVLDDYNRGAQESSLFLSEHNPFHVDSTRRPGGGGSTFVTPPDRIRHDPLRLLMQQLHSDEQGHSPESDIYNVLLNTAPGEVASILLGGDGAGGGDSYNFTITHGSPGAGRARIGTIRPTEAQADAPNSLSDLLPGGVDRALQFRRFGVQHPLLSLADDGAAISARQSRIAMLAHPSNSAQPTGVVQLAGRPLNAPPSSQINAHFTFGLPPREMADWLPDEPRVSDDLSRILMDETDSIVSAAMAHMPGGRHEGAGLGVARHPYSVGEDGRDRVQFDTRGRGAAARGASAPQTSSQVPIAMELLQRHLRDLLVQRLAVNEELSPVPPPAPTPGPTQGPSASEEGLLNLSTDEIPAVAPHGAEEQTDREVLREIRRTQSESPDRLAWEEGPGSPHGTVTETLGQMDTPSDPPATDLFSTPPPAISNSSSLDLRTLDLNLIIDTIREVGTSSTGADDSLTFQEDSVPTGLSDTSPAPMGVDPGPSVEYLESSVPMEFTPSSTSSSPQLAVEADLSPVPPSDAPHTAAPNTDANTLVPTAGEHLLEVAEHVDESPAPADAPADAAADAEVEGHAIPCPPGYEPDVFYSLPDFMQQEIADQHVEEGSTDQIRALLESIGYDYDTFASLPESIRQEILDQARRDQAASGGGGGMPPADPSNSQEMDNASFLVSLSPELRAEVLLTADAAFIASLPPELVAEAQMHRERAAAHWQQREIQQTRLAAPAAQPRVSLGSSRVVIGPPGASFRNATRPGNRSTRPTSFREEVEEEDEEGSEDEEDLDADYSRASRAVREAGRAQQQAALSPAEGLMLLPSDDTERTLAPAALLPILAGLIQDERLPLRSQYLYRLLQNIAKNPRLRDAVLRLLVSLLAEDRDAADAVVFELTDGQQTHFNFSSDTEGEALETERARTNKRRAYAMPAAPQKGGKGLSQLSASRLVAVLFHLSSANVSVIYDMLCPRLTRGGAVSRTTTIEDRAQEEEKSESVVCESKTDEDEGQNEVLRHEKEEVEGRSTDSLLEMLMPLFAHPNFTASAGDLSELTAFINVVSSPLEFIGEGAPENRMTEKYQREVKRGAVAVPAVGMCKASLRCLCEVLLSDMCTKTVSDNINAAISRLAIVRANRTVLTDLIAEVVVDLASLSQNKLEVFLASLLAVKKRKGAERNSSALAASASASSFSSPPVPYRPTANELPLGEAGGRYHERFLRAMETLDSVAAKTKRSLLDLTPSDQLAPTWIALDAVLSELKAFMLDEDEGKSESTSRPQSTLNSLLSKLLPVVEGFFLVHVTDILSGDATSTSSTCATATSISTQNTSTSPATPTGGVAPATGGISTDSGALPGPVDRTVDRVDSEPAPVLAPTDTPGTSEAHSSNLRLAHQAMPGERYRNTAAYAALNLSLISSPLSSEGLFEDRINMQNSRSFRLSQSFSPFTPLMLSHSSSGLPINFLGNTPLGRAQRLLAFVHSHKAVLNLIVRARPAVLEGSLTALVRVTQLRSYLGFDAKRKYFFSQLHKTRPERGRRSVHLQLRRGQVFEDSFHQLRMRSAEEMGGRLQVNFHGEEGIDAGGLTREWYLVLSREIFNPNYALFTAAADGATFQPNPLSMINMNHLDYFKFVGRVIGKAICDGQLMDAHFTRSFYKHVLGNPVDYTDLEAIEPEIFKSLKQILTLRLDELGLELTFSAESHIFGKHEVVDLIPGGRNVPVTDENKGEYIRLVAHHRMTAAIRSQIEAFLDGFYEQVPPELISIFSPTELELVICGLPDVDVDELYANTEYHQYRANDVMILWFWDVLRGFNREERALFLQFVTGTSKVPLEGFGSLQGMRGVQRFSIHKAYGEIGLLPTAHTCFNQLDLPIYSSQEDLRTKLLMAIKEGSEGFGFA